MRVGDSNSSFWYSLWSHMGHICTLVDFVNIIDKDLMVKDAFVDGC